MKHYLLSAAFVAVSALSANAQDISQYVQKNIKDFRLTAKATKAQEAELQKISQDFRAAYRGLKASISIRYKEPTDVRLEGKLEKTRILYIINGNKKLTSVPSLRIKQVEDITHSPGKRQTSLDIGFVTPGLLKLSNAKFLREDRNGNGVFDITWKEKDDSSRHRIWVDPKTKIIEKREWYNQQGRLMATFYYKGAAKVAEGVFFPTTIEVFNVENQFAGETTQSDFKINENPADSLFEW